MYSIFTLNNFNLFFNGVSKIRINKKDIDGFRKFEDFIREINNEDKKNKSNG